MGTIINSNQQWYVNASGITVSGTTKTYDTYQNLLKERYPGKLAWVMDASGDPTVDTGAALYAYNAASNTWTKLYETEMMDDGLNGKGYFVGWVATPEDLTAAYPEGQNGWYAIVGTTDTIWTWDSDTNTWVDSAKNRSAIYWDDIVDHPTTWSLNDITVEVTLDTGEITTIDADTYLDATYVTKTELTEANYAKVADLKPVAFTGDYNDLINTPDLNQFTLLIDDLNDELAKTNAQVEKLQTTLETLDLEQFPGWEHLLTDTDLINVESVVFSDRLSTSGEYLTLLEYLESTYLTKEDGDHVITTTIESALEDYYTKAEIDTKVTNIGPDQLNMSSLVGELKDSFYNYEDGISLTDLNDYAAPFLQFSCPAYSEALYLKLTIYKSATMDDEDELLTLDSRQAAGRYQMLYDNGTQFTAMTAAGVPTSCQGRFTLVQLPTEVELPAQFFIKWTWSSRDNTSFSLTANAAYPTITPSNAFAVGNYWQEL